MHPHQFSEKNIQSVPCVEQNTNLMMQDIFNYSVCYYMVVLLQDICISIDAGFSQLFSNVWASLYFEPSFCYFEYNFILIDYAAI